MLGEEKADTPELRKVNYEAGDVKQQLSSGVRSCLHRYRCVSFGELRTLLEVFNISIEERCGTIEGRDYAGIMYGALTDDVQRIGTPIKSSRIGQDVGYKALKRYYERCAVKIKEQELYSHTRDAVVGAMKATTSMSEFRELLRAKRIDAVFRINDAGRIYGVTFIDHESGVVANGSRLGKEFSANILEQHFTERDSIDRVSTVPILEMPHVELPDDTTGEYPLIPGIDYDPDFLEDIWPDEEELYEEEKPPQKRSANPNSLFDVLDNNRDAAEEEYQQQRKRRRRRKRHR